MNVGFNIKRIRQLKNISQKSVCHSTGIHQGTLSKIEAGSDFLWSKLVNIAEALDVNVQDIVSFDLTKVTFNLTGDKAKGMVINHGASEKQQNEIIQVLKEENLFLRKMLEKTLNKNQVKNKK